MGYVLPAQAMQAAAEQNNMILGEIAKAGTRWVPYIHVFDRGNFDLNQGSSFRTVIGERAAMAGSMVKPTFILETSLASVCEPSPATDKFGSHEFTVELGTFPGNSDPICIKQARISYKRAYLRGIEALKDGIKGLINADMRQKVILGGGTKLTMRSTGGFTGNVTGQILTEDVAFIGTANTGGLPDLPLTFSALTLLAGHMEDALNVEPFESNQGEMYIFIGSQEITNYMREQDGIVLDIRALVQGGFADGKKMLKDYTFSGPYRGIGFGRDKQPMRALSFDDFQTTAITDIDSSTPAIETVVDGTTLTAYLAGNNKLRLLGLVPGFDDLVFVEPEIGVAGTTGVVSRPNPAWILSPYEFGSFCGQHGYKRLVPPYYPGEGEMKWPDQLIPEKLEFVVIRDNSVNKFGHFGEFIYEITRAYEPQHPEAFGGIVWKRPSFFEA